nr:hypothetical protein [Streptomyces hygroscopicus]
MAGGYQGRRGVAHDGEQDLGEGAGVAAGEVGQGQHRDPGEAEGEAGQPPDAEVFGGAEEAGGEEAHDRHARDQQAGRRAGQMALGVGQGEPGDDDLQDREGQHGAPVGTDRAGQAALAQGERQQQGRAQRAAGEHQDGR